MPVEDGAGHSAYTKVKQQELTRFLEVAIHVYPNVNRKWWPDEPLTIIDATAGPGIVDGEPGSPLVIVGALGTAKPVCRTRLLLWDHEPQASSRLYALIEEHPLREAAKLEPQVVHGDNAELLLAEPASRCTGLVYWDGNGRDRPPLASIATFKRARPRADLLIHVALNSAYKRQGLDPWEELSVLLALKRHWCVRFRRDFNPHQFMFLLGSEYEVTSGRRRGANQWADKLRSRGWLNADQQHDGYELLRHVCGRGPDPGAPDQGMFDV